VKFSPTFLAVLFALCFNVGIAQAAEVDFSGGSIDMGTVSIGQFGNLTSTTPLYTQMGIQGVLPSYGKIVFDYTLPVGATSNIFSQGSYAYTSGGLTYTGMSVSSTSGPGFTFGQVIDSGSNIVGTTPLVLSFASLNGTTGIATITNLSASTASFFSNIFSFPSLRAASYNVASAVPLPASLPMFAMGLVGLVMLARSRKSKQGA